MVVLQTGLLAHGQDALQPAAIEPGIFAEEEDDVLTGTDGHEQRLNAEQVAGFIQKLGPVEHEERLSLLKASFGIPSEPACDHDFDYLPEGTRDQRHVGDLVWHPYYHMSRLSETDLPAKRYTECNDPSSGEARANWRGVCMPCECIESSFEGCICGENLDLITDFSFFGGALLTPPKETIPWPLDPSSGQQCFHEPTPILQIFNVKLQTCLADVAGPVEVYGIVAVRDDEDYCRNYLFNRSRENPLDISLTGGYLRLLSPKRGMSMRFNCLIEVDIRVKAIGDDDTEDKTLADGCMEFVEDRICFERLSTCTMSSPYGFVAFDYDIFRFGFEATIELDFLEVPEGGFGMQMCGYTTALKNYYDFIGNNCECDSFVGSTGKFSQYFVAAVQMDDYFLVDFAEGKSPLIFKSTIHGSEEKEYSFHNNALVSVKVSWSTANYC